MLKLSVATLTASMLAVGLMGVSATATPTYPHSKIPKAKVASSLVDVSHRKRCQRVRVCGGSSGTAGTTPQWCYYTCR